MILHIYTIFHAGVQQFSLERSYLTGKLVYDDKNGIEHLYVHTEIIIL